MAIATMWWTFPAIIGGIVVACFLLLCGVVCCVQRCFYPEGTRGPLVRTFGDNTGRYIGPDGKLSWKGETAPPPRVVYNS